jgi:isoleucyl-tRNA synthetase
VANKEIEKHREQGVVGSSLECRINLNCKKDIYEILLPYEEELHFIFIVSSFTLSCSNEDVKVVVEKLTYKKCERCWHYHPSVGSNKEHDSICSRCQTNLFADGELRRYA